MVAVFRNRLLQLGRRVEMNAKGQIGVENLVHDLLKHPLCLFRGNPIPLKCTSESLSKIWIDVGDTVRAHS